MSESVPGHAPSKVEAFRNPNHMPFNALNPYGLHGYQWGTQAFNGWNAVTANPVGPPINQPSHPAFTSYSNQAAFNINGLPNTAENDQWPPVQQHVWPDGQQAGHQGSAQREANTEIPRRVFSQPFYWKPLGSSHERRGRRRGRRIAPKTQPAKQEIPDAATFEPQGRKIDETELDKDATKSTERAESADGTNEEGTKKKTRRPRGFRAVGVSKHVANPTDVFNSVRLVVAGRDAVQGVSATRRSHVISVSQQRKVRALAAVWAILLVSVQVIKVKVPSHVPSNTRSQLE